MFLTLPCFKQTKNHAVSWRQDDPLSRDNANTNDLGLGDNLVNGALGNPCHHRAFYQG